jgi:hypothetical protein
MKRSVDHLLDGLPDLRQLHVDAGAAQTGLRALLHRLQQRVELRIERHREGAVHNAAYTDSAYY